MIDLAHMDTKQDVVFILIRLKGKWILDILDETQENVNIDVA